MMRRARGGSGPPGDARAPERRMWRILVGVQMAALAAVAVTVLAVWIIGLTSDLYGHR